MTTEHPITPSPVLIDKWRQEYTTNYSLARQSARWGADQELDACRKWVDAEFPTYPKCDGPASYRLADARRPKPPSLAEQALEALDRMDQLPTAKDQHLIRAALERLQELEKGNE